MKKGIYLLAALICLSMAGLAWAAEEKAQPPAATHFATPYPAAAAKLPPLPATPASPDDAKAAAAYVAAVDAYLKAAQSYIDAAGNDANFIIQERNSAIENANRVVAEYNAFFKLEEKK